MKELIKMQFGSHVYGTNLPTSDIDYKAIYMPTPREIVLNKGKDVIQHNTKLDITKKSTQDDTEVEIFSLKRYVELLVNSQTTPVGMLFVPTKWYVAEPDDIWLALVSNKDRFLSSGVSAFVGYCRTQANKYGARTKLRDVWIEIEDMVNMGIEHIFIVVEISPKVGGTVRMLEVCDRKAQEHITLKEAMQIYGRVYEEYGHRARQAEQNENIDWKALMHACRVYTETKELLATGFITYPRPDADFLLKIRLGEIPYKTIAEYLEDGLEELETLIPASVLRTQPDKQFAEDFIYKAYLAEVKNENLL